MTKKSEHLCIWIVGAHERGQRTWKGRSCWGSRNRPINHTNTNLKQTGIIYWTFVYPRTDCSGLQTRFQNLLWPLSQEPIELLSLKSTSIYTKSFHQSESRDRGLLWEHVFVVHLSCSHWLGYSNVVGDFLWLQFLHLTVYIRSVPGLL